MDSLQKDMEAANTFAIIFDSPFGDDVTFPWFIFRDLRDLTCSSRCETIYSLWVLHQDMFKHPFIDPILQHVHFKLTQDIAKSRLAAIDL